MESKHSPTGNWRYSKSLQRITYSPNDGHVVSSETVCLLPEFTDGGEETIDANAEFIVKACNSYYTIKSLLAELCRAGQEALDYKDGSGKHILQEAIWKAESKLKSI